MSTIKEVHTPKFWLTSDGRLEVYDYKLAIKINRYAKRYPEGSFTKGDEAIFYVTIESYPEYKRFLYK